MDLIPGLPDEIARQCLNRVPFKSFRSLLFVCKAWNRELSSPEFHHARRLAGLTRPIFILECLNRVHRAQGLTNLISGLPDQIAREYLNRLPLKFFPSLLRKTRPITRLISAHQQSLTAWTILQENRRPEDSQNQPRQFFQLSIFDPDFGCGSGSFSYLPRGPSLPEEFSGFNITRIVGFETNILVILYVTKHQSNESLNLVYVFDFLIGQWRRGADLPGPGRSVFGLAGDPVRRKVLVAGGYGYGCARLRSAFLYDVATDMWHRLADMERARFECSVVFHSGRFHVISRGNFDNGRSTSQERPFIRMTCAESLDPVTLQWGLIENESLEASASEYHWVMGNGKGDMYQLGQNVTFRRGSVGEWDLVAEVPNELQQHMTCAMTWRDKMVVIGRRRRAYVLDLNSHEWAEHELPYDSLYVGCGMDL